MLNSVNSVQLHGVRAYEKYGRGYNYPAATVAQKQYTSTNKCGGIPLKIYLQNRQQVQPGQQFC
jgi:hypothetical protein